MIFIFFCNITLLIEFKIKMKQFLQSTSLLSQLINFERVFYKKIQPKFMTTSISSEVQSDEIDSIQRQYLTEPCIKVNENDEAIGAISKLECHMKPILHRAFSVFIFDTDRRLLLQKRSATKITFPEVWTNTCCSHPHYPNEKNGEDGIKQAAERKLIHELGIENAGKMHLMGRFIYEARSDPVWVEHELDYVICITNFNSSVKPNPEEVCEIRFVNQYELLEMMDDKDAKFSPWFSLFYKFKWLKSWWDNLDELDALKDVQNIHKLN